MSNQVIRYETEQDYIEYTNHRRYLATGELMAFPDWGKDPEAYWKHYDKELQRKPNAVFEMWTILHKEHIDPETGKLITQDCTYDTLGYQDIEEGRASRKIVKEGERPDPGVPVSVEFKDIEEAERTRALLMQGEPGYYYAIKHRVGIAVVDREEDSVGQG